jgi:hypothetical protein
MLAFPLQFTLITPQCQAELRNPRRWEPPPDKKTPWFGSLLLSGRAELNRRPLRPERSALTGLSHAPNKQVGIIPAPSRFGKATRYRVHSDPKVVISRTFSLWKSHVGLNT